MFNVIRYSGMQSAGVNLFARCRRQVHDVRKFGAAFSEDKTLWFLRSSFPALATSCQA